MHTIYVVDDQDKLVGTLSLKRLLLTETKILINEIANYDIVSVIATEDDEEVANIMNKYDLIVMPVIDEKGVLLGRITIDDVVDVIREESESTVLNMAGLTDEEDIFAPVLPSARRRAIWLGLNLITALIASGVISLFQDTIEKVVALAVLMPIVASMGGIAGSQTLTLVIRGIALGNVSSANSKSLLVKGSIVNISLSRLSIGLYLLEIVSINSSSVCCLIFFIVSFLKS